jgi:hypothetical protein
MILGVMLTGHGLIGLFIEGDHLLELLNVDIVVDILYLAMGIALLAASFTRGARSALRVVLLGVGGVLGLLGLVGLFDREAFGILPTGLTSLDIGFQLVGGALAVVFSVLPGSSEPLYPEAPEAP